MIGVAHKPITSCVFAIAVVAMSSGCSFNEPPLHAAWKYGPVQMDKAQLPAGLEATPGQLRRLARQQWDTRAAALAFQGITTQLMWSRAGIYGLVHGARLNDTIQVETSRTGEVSPSITIWLGPRREYIRTAGADQVAFVPRQAWTWDWPSESEAISGVTDGFFVSWGELGMDGPPRTGCRCALHVGRVGVFNTTRGGGWLVWSNHDEALAGNGD